MSKIGNVLKILKILNECPQTTAPKIAAELDISIRSVYRYVDEITCCGYPINVKSGNGGGIWLDSNFKKRINSAIALISTGG